jgi:hypothetical protein
MKAAMKIQDCKFKVEYNTYEFMKNVLVKEQQYVLVKEEKC